MFLANECNQSSQLILFLLLLLDREAGQNGYTGVTIRGDDTAIESAKTYIQNLVAAK